MRLALKLALATTLVLATIAVQPNTAEAKAERVSYYNYSQVWRAAVRFLRIDEGHKIVERDLKAGYVVFEYKSSGKTYTGFLELIRLVERSGRTSVRMVMRIRLRPKYTEAGLLYRLQLKLRKELGPYRGPAAKRVPVKAPVKKAKKK